MHVSGISGWIALVFGLGAVAFAVWAVFDGKRRASLTEQYKGLFEVQKEATGQARDEAETAKRTLADERLECQTRIAALEGRLSVMESSWIQSVAAGVAQAVQLHIKEHGFDA